MRMFKIRETIAPVPSGFGRIQSFLQEEDTELHSMSSTEKNKNNSRGKFNDEQIKLLETMFETESRPEQRMKQHLANKVGLQPRQVAIWFQNKRARSKSKQIERDYSMLKISYDHLATKFETLKKENYSLLIQLQKLQELAEHGGGKECEKKDDELENDQGLRFLAYEHELGMPSSNEKSEKLNYLEKEIDVLNVGNGSLTSVHNGCNFESSSFLETSSCSSQWWEY